MRENDDGLVGDGSPALAEGDAEVEEVGDLVRSDERKGGPCRLDVARVVGVVETAAQG